MDIQRKNLAFLVQTNRYIGTTIYIEDEDPKVIKDILDYDSITHVYAVEFENGDVQQISDKIRFEFSLADTTVSDKIKLKPNKKRAKPRK